MQINQELAKDIHTIIDMIPDMHDQANWFYVYDGGSNRAITPEDVQVVKLVQETKDAAAEGKDYHNFTPTVDCNATLCVAGWACIMNGYSLVLDDDGRGYSAVFAMDKDGKYTEVMDKGRELLGLDSQLANWLFTETSDSTAIDALEELSQGKIPQAYIDYEDDVEHCDCGCCCED